MSYYDSYREGMCVYDIVAEIIEGQDEVADNNNSNGCCHSSCEQSIKDLLSGGSNNNNNGGPTTVPFMLYCKGDCKPFFGNGIYSGNNNNGGFFNCVESPVFRAKKFVNEGSHCVRLELLLPVTADGSFPGPIAGANPVCQYFPDCNITDFQATGVCITVDLNHFFAISCLDAVTPISASDFDPGCNAQTRC